MKYLTQAQHDSNKYENALKEIREVASYAEKKCTSMHWIEAIDVILEICKEVLPIGSGNNKEINEI